MMMQIQKDFDQIMHLLKLARSSVALQNRLKSFLQEHSHYKKSSFLYKEMKKLCNFLHKTFALENEYSFKRVDFL